MDLPGGIYTHAVGLHKRWGFKPLDGKAELSIWDAVKSSGSRVSIIDTIIDAACELDAPDALAADLCMTDRYFILAKLSARFGKSVFWMSAGCGSCEERFDIAIDLEQLPIKPAGDTYPYTAVKTKSGEIKFRVPRAADQAAIGAIEDTDAALQALIDLCADNPKNHKFTEGEFQKIDTALQAVSPEIAQSIHTKCPECKTLNEVPFDIAAQLLTMLKNPMEDIHEIASAYHWSEADILALPRHRRETYLGLIDADQGVVR